MWRSTSGVTDEAPGNGDRSCHTGRMSVIFFEPEGARKAPDGRCSLENGAFTLPLEAGDNEVAVAIANNFYGWGLMLRLDDVEGVHPAGM